MMFNDKYKIIYVKCPKAAGTSLLQYFTDCKAPNASQYCLRMASYGNATNVQHLLSAWDDYYVFGFSRNVLQRAISQYQYLSTFIRKECPGVAWDQFCQDPYVLGDYCIRQRDVDGQRCCTQSPEHQYQHASPQVNCLLTREGKTAVDWVGRVEQFSSDLSDLVAILNARPGVPSLPTVQTSKANYNASPCDAHHRKLRWHVRNGTENPCDKMEMFRGRHAHCYASISSFFANDLHVLT